MRDVILEIHDALPFRKSIIRDDNYPKYKSFSPDSEWILMQDRDQQLFITDSLPLKAIPIQITSWIPAASISAA